MSNIELARTITIRPPTINRKIKPSAHSMVGDSMLHPCRVSSQLKIFTPVGMATIIVAEVK